MKALVFTKPCELEFRDEPDPIPAPGEILIKVSAAGICGSDMHAWQGHDPRRLPPLILGHELSGTALGGRYAGRRVVVNPLITCGECDDCTSGRTNLCAQRELIGMRKAGAFAEYVCIPEKNLVPIPDSVADIEAALTEPAALAVHTLKIAQSMMSRSFSDQRILIAGAGAVGLLLGLLLRSTGVRSLVLADTNRARLDAADTIMDAEVYNPQTGGGLEESAFDTVFDAVGAGATRALCSGAIKPGGVFIHIGLADSAEGLDIRKLTLSEISFSGIYCYTHPDFVAALKAIDNRRFGDLRWIETFPLQDGAAAFSRLYEGKIAAAKVVLTV